MATRKVICKTIKYKPTEPYAIKMKSAYEYEILKNYILELVNKCGKNEVAQDIEHILGNIK